MPDRLEGSIKTMPMATLLFAINYRERSGTLHLTQDRRKVSMSFRDGKLFAASGLHQAERLGRRLRAQGRIDADAYERATLLSIQKRIRLGEALVTCGAITENDLNAILEEQLAERAIESFELRAASYLFVPGRRPASLGEPPPPKLGNVLRTGISRYIGFEEQSRFLETLAGNPLKKTRVFDHCLSLLDPTEVERRVFQSVDGQSSIAALMRTLGLSSSAIFPTLYLGRCTGLIRIESDSEPDFSLVATGASCQSLEEKLKRVALSHGGRPLTPRKPPPKKAPKREAQKAPTEDLPALPPPQPLEGQEPSGRFGFVRYDQEMEIDVTDQPQPLAPVTRNRRRTSDETPKNAVQEVIRLAKMQHKGEQLLLQGDFDAARAQFDKALSKHPADIDCRCGYGLAVAAHARDAGSEALKEAFQIAESCLNQAKTAARAWLLKGVCLDKMDRPKESAICLKKAVSLDSRMEEILRAVSKPSKKEESPGSLLRRAARFRKATE